MGLAKPNSPLEIYSEEEYLNWERSSEVRHEYVNGRIFDMAGGSRNHGVIITNIAGALFSRIKAMGCDQFVSDMKLRIHNKQKISYRYPDFMVYCGPRNNRDIQNNARFLVEVLSPGTREIDCESKVEEYKESLNAQKGEYLIVDSSCQVVSLWGWKDDVFLEKTTCSGQDSIMLDSLDTVLSLNDIYDTVEFPSEL